MSRHYQTQPAQRADDLTPVLYYLNDTSKPIFLSSKYSPSIEAKRILEKDFTDAESPSLIFIFGAGNIALIETACKKYLHTPIVLVTEDPKLLTFALQQLSTVQLISKRKSIFPPLFHTLTHTPRRTSIASIAPVKPSASKNSPNNSTTSKFNRSTLRSEIEAIFHIHSTKRIRFHLNTKEVNLAPNFYQLIQELIATEQEEKSINRATFARFEKLWLRNLVKNTPLIINAAPIKNLIPLMKDYPVVLAGAAPSLEDDIPLLKQFQNNLIIIAVDTAYAVLIKQGIAVDIVVSIDPQKTNAKYLEAVPSQDAAQTALIAEPSISHHGMRKFPYIFMFDNFSPYYGYLCGFFSSKGILKVGGSVATVAFEFMRQTQVKALACSGIDLAYSRERYHLSGAFHEETWFSTLHRLDNFETRIFSIMNTKDVIPVLNRNQQTVYTDAAMELYKRWFEKNLTNITFPIFHTSTRGRPLTGMPYLTLKEFIKQHASKPIPKTTFKHDLKALIHNHQEHAGPHAQEFKSQMQTFKQATAELIERIQNYHDAGSKAKKIIQKLLKTSQQSVSPKIFRTLTAINTELQTPSIQKEFVGSVMQKTIHQISDTSFIANDNKETLDEKLRLEQALVLYDEIMHASKLNVRYLKTLLASD